MNYLRPKLSYVILNPLYSDAHHITICTPPPPRIFKLPYGTANIVGKVPCFGPIYSHSLERKKVQAFCLLQIFFSGIRTN